MGVTISSKNHSIDLGYFGFFRLRQKIAELMGEDVGVHYAKLRESHMFTNKQEEAKYWKKYDEETEAIANRYPKSAWKVFDFLYASDCDGEATYGTCKQILNVIKDYNDNVIYGYAGRADSAKFSDFKKLLQDCAESKCKMKWH